MQVKPVITIITVVFNAAELIEKTIQSVVQQTYPFIEYLIIDGKSSDNTLAIIAKYDLPMIRVYSEKDKGIYDAMNKGLEKARGEYVLFLNAGDLLANTDTISTVFSTDPNGDVYYGNTKIIDGYGKEVGERRLRPPVALNWKSLQWGMCVSHQSFIARRGLCDHYDLSYKVSADIDWMIRVLKRAQDIVNAHQTISLFLEGGTSSKRRRTALVERFRIMTVHYGLFKTLLNHLYILARYPVQKLVRKSMT